MNRLITLTGEGGLRIEILACEGTSSRRRSCGRVVEAFNCHPSWSSTDGQRENEFRALEQEIAWESAPVAARSAYFDSLRDRAAEDQLCARDVVGRGDDDDAFPAVCSREVRDPARLASCRGWIRNKREERERELLSRELGCNGIASDCDHDRYLLGKRERDRLAQSPWPITVQRDHGVPSTSRLVHATHTAWPIELWRWSRGDSEAPRCGAAGGLGLVRPTALISLFFRWARVSLERCPTWVALTPDPRSWSSRW